MQTPLWHADGFPVPIIVTDTAVNAIQPHTSINLSKRHPVDSILVLFMPVKALS